MREMSRPTDSFISLESADSGGTGGSKAKVASEQGLKWKTILLLQFQPQFEIITYFGVYFTYICVVLDVMFAYSCRPERVVRGYNAIGLSCIYCFDMVYVLDILLMVFYRSTPWPEVQHIYNSRRRYMIALDIFSVVPCDAIYYSLADANMRAIYLLRLRYLLRLPRFSDKIAKICRVIRNNAVVLGLFLQFVFFTILLTTMACILFYMECRAREDMCLYKDYDVFLPYLLNTCLMLSFGGVELEMPFTIRLFMLYVFAILTYFFFINGFIVGFVFSDVFQKSVGKQIFKNIRNISLARLHRLGLQTHLVYTTVLQFFDIQWDNRNATNLYPSDIGVIPTTLIKAIYLDVSWEAFKHSHILRDRDTHFLQSVALYMNQTFGIPGETIFARNCFKDSMVYIVSGVVQVLSVQDGESPILSFSGGTCLGELNLFVGFPSVCNVVCQTYCKLQVLSRKDFQQVIKHYPNTYKQMMIDINLRIKESKEYTNFLDYTYSMPVKERELLVIQRLRKVLKNYYVPPNTKNVRSSGEKSESDINSTRSLFCAKYLDFLVISDAHHLVDDSTFIREKCPCILQSESFIMTVWNTIVAVTALLFAYIFPYYASFESDTAAWFIAFRHVTGSIWLLDVYISISTAVKEDKRAIFEIRKIAAYRFKTVTFWLDLFAAFPFDAWGWFLFNVSSQGSTLLHVFKLFKLYKISYLFRKSDYTYQLGTMFLTYFIYTTLFIYYSGAILYLVICYNFVCDELSAFFVILKKFKTTSPLHRLMTFTYLATDFAASVEYHAEGENFNNLHIPLLCRCFLWMVVYVFFLATATANTTLQEYDELRIQAFVQNVEVTLNRLQLAPKLRKRIFNFIQNQVDYDGGVELVYTKMEIESYSHPKLLVEMRYAAYHGFVKSYPLFYMLSEEVLTDVCRCFRVQIFAPGTVVSYTGEVCNQVHFIHKGYCKVVPFADESCATIESTGYALGFIEMCFGIPLVNTVIALTHVEIITACCSEYSQMLALHPQVQHQTDLLVTKIKDSEALLVETVLSRVNVSSNILLISKNESVSFKNFGYRLSADTKKGMDYLKYFDKFQCLGFLRYCVFRTTIHPYGRFIHVYETIRCILSFFGALLNPMYSYLTLYSGAAAPFWRIIFGVLNIVAWVDLCVRHHIAYFNNDGLEITHPLKTITHYWTHSFIIDLLGCIPLTGLLRWLFGREHISFEYEIISAVIGSLQCYRIYYGIQYLDKLRFLSWSRIWGILKYLPLTLITLCLLSTSEIHFGCVFGNPQPSFVFTGFVRCDNASWIESSKFDRPLSPSRVYLYGLLLGTNIIIRPTVQGFNIQNMVSAIKITMVNTLALCGFFYISAKAISKNVLANADLAIYQSAMADLIKFLSYRQIDNTVKREIIAYFEYVWRVRRKKNLKQLIKGFNLGLQSDIVFEVYGNAAKRSDVFQYANDSFFRSLLVTTNHEIIIKRGIICRVNDVQSKIFFILKGKVEVLGPDYNRLVVLSNGSLFGNLLENSPMRRQSLTMVAKGHVELLTIEGLEFHRILSKYHDTRHYYFQKVVWNSDYISGVAESKMFDESSLTTNLSMDASLVEQYTEFDTSTTRDAKIRKYIGKWETFVVPFVGSFGFALELYQITMQEHSFPVLLTAYLIDILGIINIVTKFFAPYENEYGILVVDKRKIALRYIKQPLGFFLHLASVVPLEISCLFFIHRTGGMWRIWRHCRHNRLLRVILLAQYFYSKNSRLNINVFLIRTITLCTWTILIVHALTCGIILMSCLNPALNMYPEMHCDWETSYQKLLVYLLHFSAICSIFVNITPTNYYPHSVSMIVYFIILIIVCRILSIIFISGMCTTLDIVFHNRRNYHQEIRKVIEFLARERVSKPLVRVFWDYVSLLWTKRSGHQFPMLLDEAPYYLREAVLNSMFGFHLRHHNLMRFCHTDLIRQIAAKFQTRIFLPGNYIALHKDMDGCMYFVHDGQIDAVVEEDAIEKVEQTFYSGEMFGFEQGMYPRCPHDFSYKAVVYSLILVLNRKDWFHMLDFFPASKEMIYSMRREKQLLRRTY